MKILDVPQSGSLAGTTSSRNRFGQYRRSRSTPVNPNSTAQGTVRARLAGNSAAWRALTDGQRAGWESLGAQMVRTDALGQSYALNGFQAYCSVNNNLLCAGSAVVSDAPSLTTPEALTSATITLTAASLSIAYTVTPLATGVKLMCFASPQRSAGRSFEGDYRLIKLSTAAQASPLVALTEYTAKFGVPVVGNRIFFSLICTVDGFESGPFNTSAVVSA